MLCQVRKPLSPARHALPQSGHNHTDRMKRCHCSTQTHTDLGQSWCTEPHWAHIVQFPKPAVTQLLFFSRQTNLPKWIKWLSHKLQLCGCVTFQFTPCVSRVKLPTDWLFCCHCWASKKNNNSSSSSCKWFIKPVESIDYQLQGFGDFTVTVKMGCCAVSQCCHGPVVSDKIKFS